MACKLLILVTLLHVVASVSPTGSTEQVGSTVDTNHVIVISELVSQTSSYFGLATVLIGPGTESEAGWILIGAPKGNSSEVYKDVVEPGVLWRCSLGKKNGNPESCIVLPIDPIDNRIRKLVCYANRCRNERRDASWFGMTLVGNSERVIACVPQWQRGFKNDKYKLNGLCYWLPTEVMVSDPFSVDPYDYSTQRLVPLLNQSLQVVDRFPVWSWGQAGFSAHLTDDNQLFLGAPGVNGWNGTVIRYEDSWGQRSEERERLNRQNQSEFSKYMVVQTEVPQLFYHLEYFGYAVTEGLYFKVPEEAGVSYRMVGSSSPRGSSLLGLVLVFEFPETEADLWLPYSALQGDQFGAYFGAALASADLNGDGRDELLVGSPFRSINKPKDKEKDKDSDVRVGDEGCVFVYTSKDKLDQFDEPEIICDSKSPGARFGSAIAGLGDINGDGFQDLAIGAPFENDLEGAVYIYHGKASFGLKGGLPDTYALKITPSILRLQLKGFGVSVTGRVDIDNNKTPDIAIGSPVSQNVVILRVRPRVRFETKIDVILNGSFVERLRQDTEDFLVRSCTRITISKLGFFSNKTFALAAIMKLDPKHQRFEILDSLDSETSDSYANFTLEYDFRIGVNEVVCREWSVGLVDGIDSDNPHPNPFKILQELSYEENLHQEQSTRNYDIRNTLKLYGAEFDSFCSTCPAKTTVSTELSLPVAADNCDQDGNPRCDPDLSMEISFAISGSAEKDISFIIGSRPGPTLLMSLHNSATAETAYSPLIVLEWTGSGLLFQDDSVCKSNSTLEDAITLYKCGFGDMLHRNETETVSLVLKTSGLFAKRRNYVQHFTATALPVKEDEERKNIHQFALKMKADVEGFVLGSMDNYSVTAQQPYTTITQSFELTLKGQSPVENVHLTFWFPVRRGIGRKQEQILFVTQPKGASCRMTSKDGKFWSPDKATDPGAKRMPRTPAPNDKLLSFKEVGTLRRKLTPKHLVLELRCRDSRDTACLRVECEARKVPANGTIEVQFRLSLVNEFMKSIMLKNARPILHIQTVGKLRILEDEDPGTLETADTFVHDYSIESKAPIGLWVYILSAVLGLLALVFLICLLVRCGFFRRASKKWNDLKGPAEEVMEEPQFWGRWQYSQVYQPPT